MTAVVAFLKLAGSAIWRFLSSLSLWQAVSLGLAVFALVQHFQLASARSDAARWHKQFTAEHAAREADRKAYAQAQRDAADLNRRQVEQVKQKQEEITDEVKSDLQSRLERIRRELRKPAPQGSSGGSGTGDPSQTACRVIDPAWMCLSPEERLRAAENEERHDQLINWTLRQGEVRP